MNDHEAHFFHQRYRWWQHRHHHRGESAAVLCLCLAFFSAAAGTSTDPAVILIAWPLALGLFLAAAPVGLATWWISATFFGGDVFFDPHGFYPNGYPQPHSPVDVSGKQDKDSHP